MQHDELKAVAERHLWGQFSTLGKGIDRAPIIDHGEGCYIWDDEGTRYFDGLAGLFVSQVGHGRERLAAAGAAQARKLGYFPLWTYSHPSAIELAGMLAAAAPGDINRVFFTSGGSESVESAWKLARSYFKTVGKPDQAQGHQSVPVVSRHLDGGALHHRPAVDPHRVRAISCPAH